MTVRQANIINAAIELFSEKGYNATTTAEIAKKANVAEGTIFRYFKTKKDLLFAIPEYLTSISISQVLIDGFNDIFNNEYNNFEEFLREVISNRKKFAYENMAILKVLFQEVPFHPDLKAQITKGVILPIADKGIKIIDKFKAQGQIIDIPNNTIVSLMISSVFGYFFLRYIVALDLKWDEDQEIDYLVQYIMNAVSRKN